MSKTANSELNTDVYQDRAEAQAERQALVALLESHPGATALPALERDGWLDLVPDADGWKLASNAVRAVVTVAWAEHPAPLMSRLAAGGLVSQLRLQTGPDLAVATDAVRHADTVRATAWARPRDGVLLGPLDGKLYLAPAGAIGWPQPRGQTDPEIAAHLGTTTLILPFGALELIGDDPAEVAEHEARLALLLAADALGAAERTLDLADAYLRQRSTFGAVLATHQTIQQRLVELSLSMTTTSELVTHAAQHFDEPDAPLAAWSAKSVAGRRCVWLIEQAIQLHGGLGFSWERGLDRSLHRAQRTRHLLGGVQRAADEVLTGYRARRRRQSAG
jgi:hypothetical protein